MEGEECNLRPSVVALQSVVALEFLGVVPERSLGLCLVGTRIVHFQNVLCFWWLALLYCCCAGGLHMTLLHPLQYISLSGEGLGFHAKSAMDVGHTDMYLQGFMSFLEHGTG